MFKAPSDTFQSFLSFITLIIAATNICGCTWHVNHLYDGKERPLEEVAILLVEEPIFLTRIDDIDAHCPCFLLCADRQECHIPPGMHSITAYYSPEPYYSYQGRVCAFGETVTVESHLSPGVVYRLKPLRFTSSKFDVPVIGPAGRWKYDVVRIGTVRETVCSSNPGITIWSWAESDSPPSYWIPPPYWIEYAETHCPEKNSLRNKSTFALSES